MKTLLFIALALVTSSLLVSGAPTLELDSTYSPPAVIPSDPALMYYNSPEMDHMLEPIKVRVVDDNGDLITEPVTIIATTILSTNWNHTGYEHPDPYTGTLCQHNKWSSRYGTCRFRFDNCIEMICNTTDPSYPLGKVEVETVDGVASFERLLHTKYSGADQRRIQFSATINGVTVNAVTNPFDVTLAAAKLKITSGMQSNVHVNTPMTFTVQTMAVDPTNPTSFIPLTTGRHSILNVDLTIAYDWKKFYIFFPSGNFNFHQLASSMHTLGGADVTENGYFDLVIRKQCSSGTATFTDVRILTEAMDIRLNFTQTLSYHPWERWPPMYNDAWVLDWSSWTQKTFVDDSLTSPAVAFTNAFNVTLPEMSGLVIEATSLSSFVPHADANFPFKTPLCIHAVDADGHIITDGPDSTLSIGVEISPSSACLSVDSSFQLIRGEGVFQGSICEVIDSVTLRFYATDSHNMIMHYTEPTPPISVSGEFRVAGIYPIFADMTTDLFTAAAVELVSEGVWEPDFKDSGRSMVCQYYFVKSPDVQETHKIYKEISRQNSDPSQGGSVRAIIGSTSNEDTIFLSTVSKADEMPVMGYVAESSQLSDKTAHPYFNRVSYCEGARYHSEGAYMASHHWHRVIVIKDSSHPIPEEMYHGFETHGVEIVLEITIPSLLSEPTANDLDNLPHLTKAAEQIFAAGTRLIYTYTHAPTDIYLYEEAILHGFAPINGYQWMGNSLVLSSFPLTNSRGHCLSHIPTCTAAFNSTINMPPSVTPDLWSGYWGDHLYYTLTNLDPTLLPGSTIYRWPEVLGAHSKGHDAAIAIIKGAMKIISQKKTITGSKLAEMIRTVNFTGGTGYVSFDENGDRPGYSASVYNFNPVSDPPIGVNDVVWLAADWSIDPITHQATEKQFDKRTLADNSIAPASFSYAPINFFNKRNVLGYAPGSAVLNSLVYDVPAVYWCSQGCGGGLAPDTNGTIYHYNHGTCEAQDTCVCKNKPGLDEPGYAGSACQQILCDPQCRNGECVEPDMCQCEPYWTGDDCGTPLCTESGCDSGTGVCTGPNVCTCELGYWGTDCSHQCTCMNGICDDGQEGTGLCSSCDPGYTGANCDMQL